MYSQQNPVTTGFDPRLRNLANRKICSSLFLQQLLYFQILFDIGWLIFWWSFLAHQYWKGLFFRDKDIVRTVMFIFWFLAEPLRLVAGFYGNLQENVPWLLMFTVLSFIPEHATVYYLMLGSGRRTAYTKAVQIAQAALLELEALTGIWAIRKTYRVQKEQYYLFEYVLNQRTRERREAEQAALKQRTG